VPRVKVDDIAAALLPFVRKFVGSSGGGQWSFQLLCSVPACRREDHVSTSRHGIQSERSREKASRNLALKGWKFRENPVCPECAKQAASTVPPSQISQVVEAPPNKSLERTREG
jgi:hypothetical protein